MPNKITDNVTNKKKKRGRTVDPKTTSKEPPTAPVALEGLVQGGEREPGIPMRDAIKKVDLVHRIQGG